MLWSLLKVILFLGLVGAAAWGAGLLMETEGGVRISLADTEFTLGALESVIYVVRGRARMRWGERLEYVAEAEAGDFIFVPPYVPHQEINASSDEKLECVQVRSDNEAVVVNLDIADVEPNPEAVAWVDPIHASPKA